MSLQADWLDDVVAWLGDARPVSPRYAVLSASEFVKRLAASGMAEPAIRRRLQRAGYRRGQVTRLIRRYL